MARYEHAGNAQDAHLVGDLSNSGLGLTIDVATNWPTAGTNKFWIAIDPDTTNEEHILVNARSGTSLTIAAIGDRGKEGTTALAHTSGALVRHIFSATEADDMAVQSGTNTFSAAQTFSAAVSMGSTLGVTGAATLSSTLGVTGAATLSSTLAVVGAATFTGGSTFRKAQADVRTNVSLIVGRAVTTDAQSIDFTLGAAVGAIIGRRQSSDDLTFGFDGGTTYAEKMILDTNGGLALTGGALATGATTGFLYPRSCAGTPTGTPAAIPSGSVPAVYDTTANKLWVYNGSWRSVTLA